MTLEKITDMLNSNNIDMKLVLDEIKSHEFKKMVNYYINRENIRNDQMGDSELSQLNSIVMILQAIYTSGHDTGVTDDEYDILQERLVNMGVPRLTGSIEINDSSKLSHHYTQLRGTLSKIYYLKDDMNRANKSRRTLSEWISSTERKYNSVTGSYLNLSEVDVILQPKFDGVSCILENAGSMTWLTRGDTKTNRASDISHIMSPFNKLYDKYKDSGIKFEVMMSEDAKDAINELLRDINYKNSRQIVAATINSNEPNFKVDYLLPVPLRIVGEGSVIEDIHPDLFSMFKVGSCKLSDIDYINEYASNSKCVMHNGERYRTDGIVITIADEKLRAILGRDNDINNFETAYKFTEEAAYSRVKDVEFYVSEFGKVTPVLVVNDVILKGNTINHISLSNKERFDELSLSYGDEVKVLYDIIPYATLDEKCRRMPKGRKIEFTPTCPTCGSQLDLNVVQVKCTNHECISIKLGRILNYCSNMRIQNIGYSTIMTLYNHGLMDHGIRSIYELKRHFAEMMKIDGFGRLKSRKILIEINSKRKVLDYVFMGSIGIEGLSIKSFELIFREIDFDEFLSYLLVPKRHPELVKLMIGIKGIGENKASLLINAFSSKNEISELKKLMAFLTIVKSSGITNDLKPIVFTGVRATDDDEIFLNNHGYKSSGSWSNAAYALVIPHDGYSSNKVIKANSKNIPVIEYRKIKEKLGGN